ncbi:MAG: cytochrome P450 [Steroidobacteraceae bacterium]
MKPIADLTMTDSEALRDLFATYRRLRDQDPVHRDPVTGAIVLTRYEHIRQVIADPATFSNKTGQLGIARECPAKPLLDRMFGERGFPLVATAIDNDPPEHRKMRSLFDTAFGPKRVNDIKPRIQSLVDELLDALGGRTSMEVMQELAMPVPTRIIAEQLGLPPENIVDFKRWSDAMMLSSDPRCTTEEMVQYAGQIIEMQQFIARAAHAAQESPRDDVVSDVANASIDGRPASMGEIVWTLQNVLIAGNESTTSGIGSMIRLLIESGLEATLRGDPAAIPKFVEESLRIASPLQTFYRRTTTATHVGGCPITRDQILELRYGAANCDERRYAEPDRVNLERSELKSHLAFGYGVHYCPGNLLARAEMRTVLERLLARFRNFRLAPGDQSYERTINVSVCGPARLAIEFDRIAH